MICTFLKEIGSRLYQERPKASLLELARLLNVVDGPDEGRGTGVPKIRAAMKRNESSKARFTTDENRLWFLVELPVHRRFKGEVAAQVDDHDQAQVTGEVTGGSHKAAPSDPRRKDAP